VTEERRLVAEEGSFSKEDLVAELYPKPGELLCRAQVLVLLFSHIQRAWLEVSRVKPSDSKSQTLFRIFLVLQQNIHCLPWKPGGWRLPKDWKLWNWPCLYIHVSILCLTVFCGPLADGFPPGAPVSIHKLNWKINLKNPRINIFT